VAAARIQCIIGAIIGASPSGRRARPTAPHAGWASSVNVRADGFSAPQPPQRAPAKPPPLRRLHHHLRHHHHHHRPLGAFGAFPPSPPGPRKAGTGVCTKRSCMTHQTNRLIRLACRPRRSAPHRTMASRLDTTPLYPSSMASCHQTGRSTARSGTRAARLAGCRSTLALRRALGPNMSSAINARSMRLDRGPCRSPKTESRGRSSTLRQALRLARLDATTMDASHSMLPPLAAERST